MVEALRQLYQHRELLFTFTLRQIQIKYKQSVMGLLWAVLMPMIIVLAGVLIRVAFAMASGREFDRMEIAMVAVKAVPWAFFVSSIRFASQSLIANSNLVTKIYFPREVCPLSATLSQTIDFLIASGLLIVLLTYLRVGISMQILLVPVYVVMLFFLTAALGMFLSAAALFFRDVKYIVEVVLTFAIFFTPVFYETSIFQRHGHLLLLNPVAPILEGLSECIVRHQWPHMIWFAYSAAFTVVMTVFSFYFFKRVEPAFAESI
jgi:lipopolysaccharide transport system permease protein